jgi:hypothetical protein
MEQRICISGFTYEASAPQLQEVLARIYDTPERPLCQCVSGGVPMYVAKHRQYLVKRMPDTGPKHHPTCPSYEPELDQSGLGALMGEAIIEHSPESIELRVAFPLARIPGKPIQRSEAKEPGEVFAPRHRMSLRAVTHFLFERAGTSKYGKNGQGIHL